MRVDNSSWNCFISVLILFCSVVAAHLVADTTVDASHPYAYGANIGWLNARGDITNGAVLGHSYCTGYLYSANCGWIGLGNGPTNGWQYGNASANDWGVNHDGQGDLTGYAYGANIGWIAFEQTYGQPKIDLQTGNLSGYVWGSNVGWISLSNAQAYVRTETLDAGPDTDADGIADAWEYARAGDLTTLSDGGHDEDGDGVSDVEEYAADTDPGLDTEYLAITQLARVNGTNTVSWESRPTRFYMVESTNAVPSDAVGGWTDAGGGMIGPPETTPTTAEMTDSGNDALFYRVRAVMPLAP